MKLEQYLLSGDPREEIAINLNIMEATQEYIITTKRFQKQLFSRQTETTPAPVN